MAYWLLPWPAMLCGLLPVSLTSALCHLPTIFKPHAIFCFLTFILTSSPLHLLLLPFPVLSPELPRVVSFSFSKIINVTFFQRGLSPSTLSRGTPCYHSWSFISLLKFLTTWLFFFLLSESRIEIVFVLFVEIFLVLSAVNTTDANVC